MKKCLICEKEFEIQDKGHTRKYCYECSPCVIKPDTAITHIRKAIKIQLIKYKGGKCKNCGYDKCIEALQFHHRNENEKLFEISQYQHITIRPMDEYYKEADKCDLLCSNCHIEEHLKNK